MTSTKRARQKGRNQVSDGGCCGPAGLFRWSPPAQPANTVLKRRVDRLLPRSGFPACIYFGVVVALLNIGPLLPKRLDLVAVALASLAAGAWCALNFWRCRHAHCVVTGAGWLTLAAFVFAESIIGRSLIHGDEALAFLAVLAAGLAFELAWYTLRGTNAVMATTRRN